MLNPAHVDQAPPMHIEEHYARFSIICNWKLPTKVGQQRTVKRMEENWQSTLLWFPGIDPAYAAVDTEVENLSDYRYIMYELVHTRSLTLLAYRSDAPVHQGWVTALVDADLLVVGSILR